MSKYESAPLVESVLEQVLACCSVRFPDVELYVFGSAVRRGDHQPGDVDILLLYKGEDLALAHDLCKSIRELLTYPPIDVLALSQDEERETDFIRTVDAKRFWPPGAEAA
ncbi:hypothetical protein CQW39_09340 [Streptomyces griseofuscus]|uniref:nucleotidyltransferase domain-containing protein n=1 Tax=Streptomyces griseofuscus TaxID=146922 RepID=UPI000F653F7E|nr:nucleotidyltransferase domain-containing protein [Streptomyces griseofuscus]RRQ79349.1 hypothetical protein CQW39_09340 [Streptomyces griseofuscus]